MFISIPFQKADLPMTKSNVHEVSLLAIFITEYSYIFCQIYKQITAGELATILTGVCLKELFFSDCLTDDISELQVTL